MERPVQGINASDFSASVVTRKESEISEIVQEVPNKKKGKK
jgi:hypothetical protein